MRFAPLSARRPPRRRSLPLAGSVLAHALAVAAVLRWNPPARAPDVYVAAPREEAVYLEFPRLGGPAAAGSGAPGGPRPAPVIRRAQSPVRPAAPARAADAPAEPGVPASAGGEGAATPGTDAPPAPRWVPRVDPRLYMDPRGELPPEAERPVRERMRSGFADAVRADSVRRAEAAREALARRQVTLAGRRFTVGGDSAAAGFRTEAMELRRRTQTMQSQRLLWERLQLDVQSNQAQRDSLLRARARATRERNDAARGRGP